MTGTSEKRAEPAADGSTGRGEGGKKPAAPLVKLLIEIGPLLVFFGVNARTHDIFAATAAFMAAVVVSLIASKVVEGRFPIMPLVTAGFVLVFGGLTLALRDELFIKLKPTIVNGLFCVILLGGLAAGRPFLRTVLGSSLKLSDEGWRVLTLRWALFFAFLAVANEVVWRSFSTDAWVTFKTFGIAPLTFVFMLTQLPLLQRHALEEPAA